MNDWASELLSKHLGRTNSGTCRAYAYDLDIVGRYLVETRSASIHDRDDIVRLLIAPCVEGQPAKTRFFMRGFTAWALQRGQKNGEGYSQNQVRRVQGSFRCLMRLAMDTGIVDYTNRVLPDLIDPGLCRRHTRAISPKAIRAMIEVAKQREDVKGCRDELALWLLYANALWPGEVCNIEYPAGVNLDTGAVEVCAKRGRREMIEIPKGTISALKAYLAARGNAPGPLFYGVHHNNREGNTRRLTSAGLRQIVSSLGRLVGVNDLTPGLIRQAGLFEIRRLTHGNDLWVSILSRFRVYSGMGRTWQRYQDDPIYTMREAASIVQRGKPWVHPSIPSK